ncbi:hypothetical protein ACUH91_03725 [Dermabacteraceae bacterium P9123]
MKNETFNRNEIITIPKFLGYYAALPLGLSTIILATITLFSTINRDAFNGAGLTYLDAAQASLSSLNAVNAALPDNDFGIPLLAIGVPAALSVLTKTFSKNPILVINIDRLLMAVVELALLITWLSYTASSISIVTGVQQVKGVDYIDFPTLIILGAVTPIGVSLISCMATEVSKATVSRDKEVNRALIDHRKDRLLHLRSMAQSVANTHSITSSKDGKAGKAGRLKVLLGKISIPLNETPKGAPGAAIRLFIIFIATLVIPSVVGGPFLAYANPSLPAQKAVSIMLSISAVVSLPSIMVFMLGACTIANFYQAKLIKFISRTNTLFIISTSLLLIYINAAESGQHRVPLLTLLLPSFVAFGVYNKSYIAPMGLGFVSPIYLWLIKNQEAALVESISRAEDRLNGTPEDENV